MSLDNIRKIIIFGLNGERYAADIKEVERILGYEEPTALPEAPAFVKGVINHEEKILPIISLLNKFKIGKEDYTGERKIIVVKRQEKKFGIIVDSVYEVTDIDNSIIEETPEITNTTERKYISGLIKLENNIIILLDLEKILSVEDEENIFRG
ncbi:chemotaxis protein CheW [uncultured Clostridium sp.]|uniref:chemotaxis protein CheW n=1 Tax=uncultured Clostridium sp. TaxID=59620 RepID=UPI0025E8132D|nr:chemotaxis protein CheW [uncultured Clostridium sp.]